MKNTTARMKPQIYKKQEQRVETMLWSALVELLVTAHSPHIVSACRVWFYFNFCSKGPVIHQDGHFNIILMSTSSEKYQHPKLTSISF